MSILFSQAPLVARRAYAPPEISRGVKAPCIIFFLTDKGSRDISDFNFQFQKRRE